MVGLSSPEIEAFFPLEIRLDEERIWTAELPKGSVDEGKKEREEKREVVWFI